MQTILEKWIGGDGSEWRTVLLRNGKTETQTKVNGWWKNSLKVKEAWLNGKRSHA